MDKVYTPIPRLFNTPVANAKKHVVESLNAPDGYYINDGWAKRGSDAHGNQTIYYDNNHDHWIDEKVINSSNGKTIKIENTNPNKDNLFDLYREYEKGQLTKLAQDVDKDGKYDFVELYENGVLKQKIEDRTKDGEPETYTFYDNGETVVIDTRSFLDKVLDFFTK